MKNNKHEQNELQRMMEGRAARMIAAAVTVFLCVLTLFEFVALKMEWNVPALAVLSGDNGLWTREYQREELVMDGSTENILLADDGETPLTGSGENAKTNVGENGSGGTAQTGENAGNGEDLQVEGTEAVRQEETETPDVSGTGKAEADVKETQTPEFSYYIRINRKQNCVTIYTRDEEGEYTVPYKAMVCSTGLYNATPRGTYQISTKYLWRELYGGVYGQYATRIQPIFCDPSHIGGKRELVAPLCQQAMDLNFDGLIVESHCNPDCAWSDASQQVTPDVLDYILNLLVIRTETQTTESLSQLRKQIDECDDNIIQELAKRMRVAREIGTYKKEHGITVLQAGRYNEILEKRGAQGEQCGMSADFMKLIFEAIHEESVRQQIEIINK